MSVGLAVLEQQEQVLLEQLGVDGQVGGDDGRGEGIAHRVAPVHLVRGTGRVSVSGRVRRVRGRVRVRVGVRVRVKG